MAQEPERDLNGLPREKLAEVLESFRDPEVFNAVTGPWKSRVAWQGGMKARAFMRNHTVDMGRTRGPDGHRRRCQRP